MKFIDTLLANSSQQEAKLYGPSEKAAEKPDIGITIQNPGAFHVIKDCARIAHGYIPLFVFEQFESPFDTLKGKFTKEDIIELFNASKNDVFTRHLIVVIVNKANQAFPEISQTETVIHEPLSLLPSLDYVPFNPSENVNIKDIYDPYGEYSASEQGISLQSKAPNLTSASFDVELLMKAFSCS